MTCISLIAIGCAGAGVELCDVASLPLRPARTANTRPSAIRTAAATPSEIFWARDTPPDSAGAAPLLPC